MKFKEGQQVMIRNTCSGCEVGEICILHYGSKNNKGDNNVLFAWPQKENVCGCSCQHNWELVDTTSSKLFTYDNVIGDQLDLAKTQLQQQINIKETNPTGNKIMSDIVNFVRNLSLSNEDKVLREVGLQNELGNMNATAERLVIEKIINDNKSWLVEQAEAMLKAKK